MVVWHPAIMIAKKKIRTERILFPHYSSGGSPGYWRQLLAEAV
jgi:hypothetical protein